MPPNSRVESYAAIRRDARGRIRSRNSAQAWCRLAHGAGCVDPRRGRHRERRTDPSVETRPVQTVHRRYPDRGSGCAAQAAPHGDPDLRPALHRGSINDVSYPVVRACVAKRRPEISVERGRGEPGAFIPQTHLPGREAEVDFGEVSVRLRGQLVTCHLFSLRMSYSGKAVHRASATGGQEAFFEGHVHAFEVLGVVPAGKIRYDNLKAALAQVIGFSRQRVETDRWVAFRSHFDIDAFYCQPGAHEKTE